jgi:hypothetical protein
LATLRKKIVPVMFDSKEHYMTETTAAVTRGPKEQTVGYE